MIRTWFALQWPFLFLLSLPLNYAPWSKARRGEISQDAARSAMEANVLRVRPWANLLLLLTLGGLVWWALRGERLRFLPGV